MPSGRGPNKSSQSWVKLDELENFVVDRGDPIVESNFDGGAHDS